MTDKKITFVTFDEAVASAIGEPGVEFVGIRFVEPFSHLGLYFVNVDPDEPDYVNIEYEGGELFSSFGEEDFYGLSRVPDGVKNLFYARISDLVDGNAHFKGMNSEFVLQEVLPGLDENAKYRDQTHFKQVAGAAFCAYWRQV